MTRHSYHQCEALWQSLWWGWDSPCSLFRYTAAWQRRARPPLCLWHEAGKLLQPRQNPTNIKQFGSHCRKFFYVLISCQRRLELRGRRELWGMMLKQFHEYETFKAAELSWTHPHPCWWTLLGYWAPDLHPHLSSHTLLRTGLWIQPGSRRSPGWWAWRKWRKYWSRLPSWGWWRRQGWWGHWRSNGSALGCCWCFHFCRWSLFFHNLGIWDYMPRRKKNDSHSLILLERYLHA